APLLFWLRRFAGHWHKTNRQHRTPLQLAILLFQQVKLLIAETADWNNHPTAFFQLIDQRLWHVIGRARDSDRVKWRMFRPAFVAVANFYLHIFVAETLKSCRRGLAEGFDNFNRVNFRH